MKRPTYIILIAAAMFATVSAGYSQTRKDLERWSKIPRTFNPEHVQHPRQIYVIWQAINTTLEFRLPNEPERSGVANLLFRNRESGEVSMLYYMTNTWEHHYTHDDGSVQTIVYQVDSVPRRRPVRFEKGDYDAIVLYNSGKYISYENFTIGDCVRTIVDMTVLPVRRVDEDSRKWLELRKFNDIIGTRKIRSWYEADNTDVKVSGYIFDPKTGLACSGIDVKHPTESDRRTFSSSDGYFEYNPVESETGSTLEIRRAGYEDMKIEIEPDAGYFIVMEYPPYEISKMIGTDTFK